MSGKGFLKIFFEVGELEQKAKRFDHLSDQFLAAGRGAKNAVGRPGLPGYAQDVHTGAAVALSAASELLGLAAQLRVKARLAQLAMGGSYTAVQLRSMERYRPDEYAALLRQLVRDQFVERSVKMGSRAIALTFQKYGIEVTAKFSKELAIALELERQLFVERLTSSPAWRAVVRDFQRMAGRVTAAQISQLAAKRGITMTSAAFSVMLSTGLQVYDDWNQDLEPWERAGRIGVSAGAGLIALGACPETAGVGCVIAVGFGAAWAVGRVNAMVFPSDQEELARWRREQFEKQVRELRKVDRFIFDYRTPTRWEITNEFGPVETREYRDNSNVIHKEIRSLYDNALLYEKVYTQEGFVAREQYFTPDGEVIEEYSHSNGYQG